MVEVKVIIKGKVSTISKKEFKNNGEVTIAHYLNFIKQNDDGELNVIKVKINDKLTDFELDTLKEKFVGKVVEFEVKQLVMNNNNKCNIYYSTSITNLKIIGGK